MILIGLGTVLASLPPFVAAVARLFLGEVRAEAEARQYALTLFFDQELSARPSAAQAFPIAKLAVSRTAWYETAQKDMKTKGHAKAGGFVIGGSSGPSASWARLPAADSPVAAASSGGGGSSGSW